MQSVLARTLLQDTGNKVFILNPIEIILLLFSCCFTAIFGIILGLSAVFINDGSAVRSKGFFQGYNKYVWAVIFLQVEINYFCVA